MPRPRKTGNGLPKGVYWQSNAWRYKCKNARERDLFGSSWILLGKTEDDVLRDFWQLVGCKIGAKGGMDKLWQKYSKEVLPTKRPRTRSDDEKMWALMKPMFEDSHPSDITRSWGIQYLYDRGVKGIGEFKPAPSRAKKEFALLRHMLNKAVDWEIIDKNPLQGLRVNDYIKTEVRDRVPDEWELVAVKKHGDLQIQLFIDFKYMSGLDQSTCFGLKIPSFDGPGLPVKRSKTHKSGYVKWYPEFIDVCRELIALNNNRCEYLFCNSLKKKVQVDSFSHKFKRAVDAAIKAGDLIDPFTPNDIRSSHGTDAEEKHGLDASKQLLNSPGAKKHYVHKRRGDEIIPLPRLKNAL